MDSLTYIRIQDKDINTYLDTRNLKVNRQYSNTNEKIDKISHYIWWFSDKSRTSYLVKKENKNILILTEDKKFINGKLFINNGFMAFKKKTNVFDLLKAIKWQNENIKKYKNCFNIILVDRKNKFGLWHNKYFNFKELTSNDDLYKILKDEYKFKKNIKPFYKRIVT